MSTEIETKMQHHAATEYSGGYNRGVMLQITTLHPHRENPHDQPGFIQLDLAEAAALRNTLSAYIRDEAVRRHELLREEIERIKINERTVFHEIAEMDPVGFEVADIRVDMVDKFCPKSPTERIAP